MSRLAAAVAFWALCTTASVRAYAEDDLKRQCAKRALEGQQFEDAERLRAARSAYVFCGSDSCPAIVASDCRWWLVALDRVIPSVVFFADGVEENAKANQVWIDGEHIVGAFDGKPVQVDPGPHRFRFILRGHRFTQDVIIRKGEQNRRIRVVPPNTVAKAPDSTKIHKSVYILTGIGAVALGTAGYFGATGLSGRSDLKACKPHCDPDRVDSTRKWFVAADITGAVGVVALSAALWIYLDNTSSLAVGGAYDGKGAFGVLTGSL